MPVPVNSSFDADFYLSTNKDVKTAAETAIKNGEVSNAEDFAYDHWLNFGARETRKPNAFFNTEVYLLNNKDVKTAFEAGGLDPLAHYDNHGWQEKRSTGVKGAFDVTYYTDANPAAVNYGSPLAYFIAALHAATRPAATTSLGFAASAYAPTAAYANFNFVSYLNRYSDVAAMVLGGSAMPTDDTSLSLAQKGKTLYHWFNYGQLEGRVAFVVDSVNNDLAGGSTTPTISDFPPPSKPEYPPVNWDIAVVSGTNPGTYATSYLAVGPDDSFSFYVAPDAPEYTLQYEIDVFGSGGRDSAFIWDSAGGGLSQMIIVEVANLVFANKAGGTKPTAITDTALKGVDLWFGDGLSTKLAVIHSGSYKINDTKSVTGHNNAGMAFYNIEGTTSNLLVQGLTSGASGNIQYELFGYNSAPIANRIKLTLNNSTSASTSAAEDYTVVNIASEKAGDINTLAVHGQSGGGNKSAVTLTAADGDGRDGPLVTQTISRLIVTGDKDVTLSLKDGDGTKAFVTLDVSGFKGAEFKYTSSFSNHLATVLGSSAKLSYSSSHGANDQYGQTFQFGTTTQGSFVAGTLNAVKTVGKIDVSNVAAGANIVDHFNLSTKIFGFTAAQWASVYDATSTLTSIGGVLAVADDDDDDESAGSAMGDGDSAAEDTVAISGRDSFFYVGEAGTTANGYQLSDTAVDLSFGETEAGKGHAAIVLLQSKDTANKMDIYFTDDNTQFNTSHATLIGSYAQTGAWGADTGKLFNSSNFHIVD